MLCISTNTIKQTYKQTAINGPVIRNRELDVGVQIGTLLVCRCVFVAELRSKRIRSMVGVLGELRLPLRFVL